MKRNFLIVTVIFLLVLDWAALHDILKGEPNPYEEYAFLIFSLTILSGLAHKALTGGDKVK